MADTEVGTGAGESLEFVNAMWRGDHVIAWNRLEDGRIAEKRYRAEYSYFLRTRDLDRAVEVEVAGLKRETTVRKEVRRSRATRDIRIEGEFARVICTDSDSRYRACRGTRDRPSWFEYHGIETFEADLHPVKRWLIDQEPRIQKPRRAYFDIETDSRVPFSRKLEMRILCWAMVTRSGERVLGMLESDTDREERILLEDFWGEVEDHDQLLAWNGDRFDFELIKHRTKLHRIRIDPRRWLWLDHMEAFRKYNMHSTESGEEKDSVALDRVAEGLRLSEAHDVEAIGDKRAIDPRFTWQLWEGGGEGREQLGRRCLADASLMAAVERKTGYLELHDTVCQTCGLFPDSRALSARDHVEAFVMRLANKRALRFPSKWGKPDGPPRQKFRGAVVFDVKPGIRRDVHVCDFAGMYPGIIETFNLSPEMIAPELAGREGETWQQVAARLPLGYCVAPGTREVFRTELEGVLAETVRTLKQSRKSLKKVMKANPENSPVWLAANRLSQGAKITVNSGFGVASSEFSRLCDVRVGESITLTGALLINRTVELSRQVFPDSEIVFGDTDSIAICGPTADQFRAFVERCNRELYPAIIEQARGRTNQLELEYEKELELLIQTGVKKRYAGRYKGVSVDTDPVIKGLEFKRGDTARFTRYFQQEVIARLLMIGQEVPSVYPVQPEEFVETIERWKARVLTGELVRRDVVISKSINKELRDYVRKQKKDGTLTADPIHVAIARMLEERGEDVSEGTRIEYVVADGDASPIRAIPAVEWEPGKEDRFYLWERVVWKPTRRVLEACWPGYDWSRWDHAKDRGGGRGRSRYLPGQSHLPWFGQ